VSVSLKQVKTGALLGALGVKVMEQTVSFFDRILSRISPPGSFSHLYFHSERAQPRNTTALHLCRRPKARLSFVLKFPNYRSDNLPICLIPTISADGV
jgi:hypothetical protein